MLEALAALASNTVVAAATTDAWEAARRKFARLLGRGDATKEQLAEKRLEKARQRLRGLSGRELEKAQADLVRVWQVRLADLLAEDLEIESELRALVEEIGAQLPAGTVAAVDHAVAAQRDVNISVSGQGVGAGVIDGNVTVGSTVPVSVVAGRVEIAIDARVADQRPEVEQTTRPVDRSLTRELKNAAPYIVTRYDLDDDNHFPFGRLESRATLRALRNESGQPLDLLQDLLRRLNDPGAVSVPILVLGDYGEGKTRACGMLAFELASHLVQPGRGTRLPLIVPLRDASEQEDLGSDQAFAAYAARTFQRLYGAKVSGTVTSLGLSPGISHANDVHEKVPLAWEDRACLGSCPLPAEGTLQVKNSARSRRVVVSADGRGLVSGAGAVLLWETMRVTGLGRGLSVALEPWRAPRAVHDPGKIVADLAAALALGGDCLADIAVLREQPDLAGPVASDPVVSRLVRSLAGDGPRALAAIRAARAAARERAWALAGDAAPGGDGGLVTIDLDATIVIAHSEKEQAAPTWKKTFGHHPMTAWADHGAAGSGEPLALVLRPGNAGSNTAADHIEAAGLALAQLPAHLRRTVLVRADSGGGTHEFLTWLTARSRRLHYSVGMTITGAIAEAIGKVPAEAWTPAYDGGGRVRKGAWVADITGLLDLDGWPAGMRVIVRKERPHPGAQLRFTDIDGHRFTAFATDTKRGQLADLELRHRRRARCEDRIRNAKDTGLRNLPLKGFAANQVWCEIVALACELLAWTQLLALTGKARRWEPKRLRLRLFAIAGRLARTSRRLRLRLAQNWPWAADITAAITRLQAIPSG